MATINRGGGGTASSPVARGRGAVVWGLLVGLAVGGAGGCASTVRDVSASATPVVVHAGLHEANTPDSQEQLKHLLASDAIRNAGQSIGEGVGVGLFNQANKLTGGGATATAATDANSPLPTGGGTTQPTSQPAGGAPGSKPAAATPGAAAVMGLAGGGGGLNGLVKSSVQEAFLAATDPQFKKGEEAMSEAIGEGAVKGMITVLNEQGPAIGDTIRKQLGPIVQMIIKEQLAPAISDVLKNQIAPAALQVWREGAVETLKLTVRPDLQPDVIQNAHNASLGASQGTHDALVNSGLLTRAGDLGPHVKVYLWVAAVAAGLIIVALFSLLVMLNLLVLQQWRRRNRPAAGER